MKKKKEILADGSVKGETFSSKKYKGEYPRPKDGKETYEEFVSFLLSLLVNLLILLVAMIAAAILTFSIINKYEKRKNILKK